jgi:AraC-like DNA-binding protein
MTTDEMRSQLVPLALAYVRARGGDPECLRIEFALPTDAETAQEVRLPLARLQALLDAASELAGDPWLGCSLVAQRRVGAHGLMEFGWRSAATVAEGLHYIASYSALLNKLTTIELTHDGDCARFTQRFAEPEGAGRHVNEFFVASFVAQTRALTQHGFIARRAFFAHARPPLDLAPLRAAAGTSDLVFSADMTGVEFAADVLQWKLHTADRVLRTALEAHAATAVDARDAQFLNDVRDAIRKALPEGPPPLAALSRSFRMGARTLQRRLADQQTNLHRLIDSVREEEARRAVRGDVPLTEIAMRLGYSDGTTFLRAFRRWTGTTPGRFRRGG